MSQNITLNGTVYTIPDIGDTAYWQQVTNWIVAATAGLLQKSGGTFTLTSELDFGSSFGVKGLYYKSRTANPSASGIIRLAQADAIGFRNAANGADLLLSVSSDLLQFAGSEMATFATVTKTEFGRLSGVTSGIQSQLNAKLTNPLTTNGDLIVQAGGVAARLAVGGNGLVLTVVGGAPAWSSVAGTGDVVGPAGAMANSLPVFNGATGKLLKSGFLTVDTAGAGGLNSALTTTAVTVSSAGENVIGVTDTSAPRTITLSDADKKSGRMLLIKDQSGNAANNNITISPQSGTIDGQASLKITQNYGKIGVYSDGINWFTYLGGSVAYTAFHLITAASTNATSIKASPGILYGWNYSAVGAHCLKFYDKASAPTVGTDVPVITVQGNSTQGFNNIQSFTDGIKFSNGIAIAVTGAAGDADSSNTVALETVDVFYI